ncbi:MAG: MaoC family dehydratase [Burkholderiaceae bacterium]
MARHKMDGKYEDIQVGATESFTRLVDDEAIDSFSDSIQSNHPIHSDGEWVRANSSYQDRIAHGVMLTAYMSRPLIDLMVVRMGINGVLISTASRYLKPVLCGDTITTRVRLVEKMDARKRLRFEVEMSNQRGELVMVGEAVEQCT